MGFKSPPKSAEAKAEWLKWLANPNGETQQQLSKRLSVSETTLIIWKKAHTEKGKTKEQLGEETFLELVKSAKRGNAAAGRTVLQSLGMLIEKQEEKHTDFTPEQYIEISLRVLNGLKRQYGQGRGNCPVCNRPSVFYPEVCEDTGQDKTTGGPFQTFPISDKPDT